MTTYDSDHTGQQVDQVVDIVLANVNKGDSSTPVYLDANGSAVAITKSTTPTQNDSKLITSGAVYTGLAAKYNKADISTNTSLGTSNTVISSQGAVKTYIDTQVATRQVPVSAGDNIDITDNVISMTSTSDFLTVGDLDNKVSHFGNIDKGYGETLLAKMEAAKRSTFDKSKFTVVGSPIVTSDGIASGFDYQNYISIPNTTINGADFEIKVPFKMTSSQNSNGRLFMQSNLFELYVSETFFTLQAHSPNFPISESGDTLQVNANLSLNTQYFYVLKCKNGSGQISVIDENNTIINSGSFTYTNTNAITLNNSRIGAYISNTPLRSFIGQIDLKQFLIKVEGVDVFSGNKTGIDTLKPNNYQVQGSGQITITDDGILSGYDHSVVTGPSSVTNYAYIPNSVLTQIGTKNWRLEWEKLYIAPSDSNMFVFGNRYYTSGYSALNIGHFNNDGTAFFANLDLDVNGTVTKSSNIKIDTLTTLERNRYYKGSFEFKDGIYTLTMDFGGGDVHTASLISSYYLAPSNYNLWINSYFDTPIDLNTIKLYIDGDLVYQPCLKIPYTLTSSGKKVVDEIYRERVEDEFGQVGYTPYYTLQYSEKANYNAVGAPTITSDWIASGFDTNAYLFKNLLFAPTANDYWEITTSATLNTSAETKMLICLSDKSSATASAEMATLYLGGVQLGVRIQTQGGNLITFQSASYFITLDTYYTYKLGYNAEGYYCKYTTDGVNWTSLPFENRYPNDPIKPCEELYIGWRRANSTHYWRGSINLSTLELSANNTLIYSAITPPNYTMATVKESDVVASYDNGMSKWTQYANLTVKQQGSCVSGVAVTLPKAYRDVNYALSVPYSAKTAAGFTPSPSASGDYIANGKVSL